MALDVKLLGSSSNNGIEVDANNQAKVTTSTDVTKAGFVRFASENDPGTVTGTARCASPETSNDFRMRVGLDVMRHNDTFNYTSQDSGCYSYVSSTMTFAQTGGALTTNNGSITSINSAAAYRTNQLFPLFGQQTPLYAEISASLTAAMATNTTIDFGLFSHSGASPYVPNDGVFFRWTSAGLFGVINFNGVDVSTTSVFSFTATTNQVYQFLISINEREVAFWIDDILYATLTVAANYGQPFMSASLPWQVRHAIGGTVAGSVVQFKIWDMSIQAGDIHMNLPLGVQAALLGNTLQVQRAATIGGQLTTYASGAEPAAVTLTANTAPATNTLGGLFILPTTITPAASDYPLFAWLNPFGTTSVQGRTFICTGGRIGELTVGTAVTGGPINLSWAIGFGSSAASLATTETASFTAPTTKIARKIPIGSQAVAATAAVGTLVAGFSFDFSQAPLPIHSGEYLHVILRIPTGTATSAGAIRGSVALFGYFV